MLKQQRVNGWFVPDSPPEIGLSAVHEGILNINKHLFIFDVNGELGVCDSGTHIRGRKRDLPPAGFELRSSVLPQSPQNLGNPEFKKKYAIDYAYLAGDMANGISSVELVRSAAKAGMLGFFGSAGLKTEELEKAIIRLKSESGDIPFGVNLIASPGSPGREFKLIDLFLKHDIRLISAAGFLRLSAPLVYYRLKGIHRSGNGDIICPNRVIAKASRPEVARLFLSPAPEKIIRQLLEQKKITETEAELSRFIPVADDLTAEADSAGHTDNRPAITLLPSLLDLRDRLYREFNYPHMPCIGLAGGIGTPMSVAAAFTLGADYVLTGSINQACIESGTSDEVRRLLSTASQADVAMAPSADMFERGIRVQVLKHQTLFPQRAVKLYECYRQYDNFDLIPEILRKEIQEKILKTGFKDEWEQTRNFFADHDPEQLIRAENNPRHQMALVFRAYLGKSSRWAIHGNPQRKNDYQIWCGPSMGAFNEWTRGTFLEKPENRSFETLAMNLMYGACIALRRQMIVNSGVLLPPEIGKFRPMTLTEIQAALEDY